MSLSVIIATFNHAHFLPECLDSVFTQELPADEVIIINDASTDNTIEVINFFIERYPQIVFLNNERNIGPARSLNRALAIAKGDYIAGCAADDLVMPNFFKRGVAFLDTHPTLAFCCGDTYHFKDEKPYNFQFLKTLNLDITSVFDPAAVQALFQTKNFVIQSHSCIYRRSSILENGGFIPELRSLCDWYLNVCLALQWGFGYIPEPFAAYRLCGNSYANNSSKNSKTRMDILNYLFYLLDKNKELKKLFKKCFLFSQFHYRYFFDFFKTPRFWDLTLPSFSRKARKIWKNRIQSW